MTRACALTLLGGHDVEARGLFLRIRGKNVDGKMWEVAVVDAFNELRRAGCGRLLMDEIEQVFTTGDIASSNGAAVAAHRSDDRQTEFGKPATSSSSLPMPYEQQVAAPSIVPDFEELAQRNQLKIADSFGLQDSRVVRTAPNLMAGTAVFKFSR